VTRGARGQYSTEAWRKLEELRRVTTALTEADKLRDHRITLFLQLRLAGVTFAEIAEAAQMTPAAVMKAVSRVTGSQT